MITKYHLLPKVITIVALLLSTGIYAQKKGAGKTDSVKIVFDLNVGGTAAVVGQGYTDPFGEVFSLQKFKFYITQVQIIDSSDMSVQFFSDDYFLIDAGDAESKTITLPLSLKHITSISFLVGVDSASNVSGVQAGSLDPANGMFWTWNSGYVMMKLQGISTAAAVPGNSFTFDVGGFKPGENATRMIELLTGTPRKQAVRHIKIGVDINKLFNGQHDLKIADHPMVHEPGALAMQFADNYSTMFSLQEAGK